MTELNPVEETEDQFIAKYDIKKYAGIGVTVDLAIFTIRNSKLCVLLIERGGHPEKGKWALPGGFVDVRLGENLDQAAARELNEETNVTIEDGYLEQLKTYGDPTRDRRGFIVSVSYVALVPKVDRPQAGDDAANAHFFPVDEVLGDDFDLAFDHNVIIRDGLDRVRAKIEYAPIAHRFLEDEVFTISELLNVYEIVWGVELIPGNFRRKVLSIPGYLESVGAKRTSSIEGGRASQLYRANPVGTIFPPLRAPGADIDESEEGEDN